MHDARSIQLNIEPIHIDHGTVNYNRKKKQRQHNNKNNNQKMLTIYYSVYDSVVHNAICDV